MLLAGALSVGCSDESTPTRGISLSIKGPLFDSPFDDPAVAFVALVAEGPDIPIDSVQTVVAYASSASLSLPRVPYGQDRQLRVELYRKGADGQPALPVIGRGRTTPTDIEFGELFNQRVYVTKTNAFTPPYSDAKQAPKMNGRAGASVVVTSDDSVIIAGGADAVDGKSNPLDPASWGGFKSSLARYDVGPRVLEALSSSSGTAALSVGRAFMASAVGKKGKAVFAGGYSGEPPTVSNLMEFYDPSNDTVKTSPGTFPHLRYGRARHTITRLFDDEDYFMVVGGQGTTADAASTREIWHPEGGRLAIGKLSGPRWNHGAVRLPNGTGGHVMLIGGENENGPLANFEVIQFDACLRLAVPNGGGGACKLHPTCTGQGVALQVCEAPTELPTFRTFPWPTVIQPLAGGVGRSLPAVAYVHNTSPSYHLVMVVGGFADAKKTHALTRVDVFDVQAGAWLPQTSPLLTPRGAPLLAWTRVGHQRGQVLVTGGLDANGQTLTTGEVLTFDLVTRKVLRTWVANELPPPGRVFAGAVALSTGHVLIAGGAGRAGDVLQASSSMLLYNPR